MDLFKVSRMDFFGIKTDFYERKIMSPTNSLNTNLKNLDLKYCSA